MILGRFCCFGSEVNGGLGLPEGAVYHEIVARSVKFIGIAELIELSPFRLLRPHSACVSQNKKGQLVFTRRINETKQLFVSSGMLDC